MPRATDRRRRRASATRRILIAVAVATPVVAVIVYIFAQASQGPMPGPQGQNLPPVGEDPGLQLGGEGQVAINVDIAFQDPKDPSRTQARLNARQMAPQGPRGFLATAPRMWIYQSAGQTIHVQADKGDLTMPVRSQPPERGNLAGNVLIRLYQPGQDTNPSAIDGPTPATMPVATFTTTSLDFNVELGTLSTRQIVNGSAENLTFRVNGLDVRGNEVTNQLERLESPGGGTATYTPPARARADKPAAEQPQPATTTRPAGQPAGQAPERVAGQPRVQADPPVADSQVPPEIPAGLERYYHVQIQEEVTIVRDTMTTTADTLDAWVRLVDDRLPEGAFAPLSSSTRTGPLDTTARLMAALLASIEQQAQLEGATDDAMPITLSWQGPLVARPLADRPRELAADDVAMRLSAPHTGLVRLVDTGLGATGHAATVDYYPTTQRAILMGPAANSVYVTAPGIGEARGIRVELDLLSNNAALVGPGQLTAMGKDQQGSIVWAERGDLAFTRTRDDAGKTTIGLRSANFKGKVQANAQDARLAGDRLDARFYDPPATAPQGKSPPPLLRRLVIEREANEPATASSERTGTLTADRIEVDLALNEDLSASLPKRLIAIGNVSGRGQDATFAADHLDADLSATLDGTKMRTDVQRAILTGKASIRGKDRQGARVAAQGERILLRPEGQYAELIAADGQIASATRAGTTIEGPQVTLDGLQGKAEVFGPGRITHVLRREGRQRPSTLTMAWDNFMLFDDAKGSAEADGNARATITDDRTEEDRIAAANIQLAFATPPQGVPDPADLDFAQGERQLLWARAEADPQPGSMVIIESLRYATASGGNPRQLQSALVLLAPEVQLDGPTSDLLAQGRGRAIILERPTATPLDGSTTTQQAQSAITQLTRSGAGQTLADWQGDMRFDRAAQQLTLRRAVRLSHRAGPQATQLDLDCETLVLTLEGLDRARSATTLRRANAQGAVYAATDERELVAKALDYDATTGMLNATGDPMAPVVVFDKRSAQPVSAAAVRWNLNTGEFTITRPLPAGGALPQRGP